MAVVIGAALTIGSAFAPSPAIAAPMPASARVPSSAHDLSMPGSPDAAPNDGTGFRINEVMFNPAPGDSDWVELYNGGAEAVDISGWYLIDETELALWYQIPAALPPVPAGAYVVVRFDGQDYPSNDYDFNDGVATLHSTSGLEDILGDDAGQVAFYRDDFIDPHYIYLPAVPRNVVSWNPFVPGPPPDPPESPLIDFVAWGQPPGSKADEAMEASVWHQDWYVVLYRGLGEVSEEVAARPGESIGRLPGSESNRPEHWMLYQTSEVTPGAANAAPVISWYYPGDGAVLGAQTFSVIWDGVRGATGYRFQLDDDSSFVSPVVDETLTEPLYSAPSPVPDGTYYWRVQVQYDGYTSPWSPGVEVNSQTLPLPDGSGPDIEAVESKTLPITWQLQHKDTNMLCLDGDKEGGPEPWNAPHTVRGVHGENYCARASVAMIASYYGGKLSQDRITYEIFKGGSPRHDVGHHYVFLGSEARAALNWALGTVVPPQNGKPSFEQIKGWIDDGRPIRAVIPGHSRVLAGYLEYGVPPETSEFLVILDPYDHLKYVRYEDDNIKYVQVGPAGTDGAPNVKSDEDEDNDGIADTMDDSDNDGVCDFDELFRFHTGRLDADTDNDLVPDLQDIREYVLNTAGNYQLRKADFDGDGRRKELDTDNDRAADDGLMDGCEDFNRDGKYQLFLGETSNFRPRDDNSLQVRLEWTTPGADVDLHLIKPGGSYRSEGDCYYNNKIPDWGQIGLPCDDPALDVDCINDCAVENIKLGKLESGTYTVKVHYYSDHDQGRTLATVTLWLLGEAKLFQQRWVTDDQIWDVATVEWPSGTVTPLGTVSAGPAGLGLEAHPDK
jgi:hypothetical protein